MKRFLFFLMIPIALSACADFKSLLNDGKATKTAAGSGRMPLDIPPELREKIDLPSPDKVAENVARSSVNPNSGEKEAIVGRELRLDTRAYDHRPTVVFSAVVDAMTSLNLPVESVDSPSGMVITDWVRPNANSPNAFVGATMDMFSAKSRFIRYRFVVRVFRSGEGKSELQIQTLGQQYINRHWVNKGLKHTAARKLFTMIEERLGNVQADIAPVETISAPESAKESIVAE
ncbi:MAG: hypothetical protein R8K53_04235 [Mariprofundaceae bacterium]